MVVAVELRSSCEIYVQIVGRNNASPFRTILQSPQELMMSSLETLAATRRKVSHTIATISHINPRRNRYKRRSQSVSRSFTVAIQPSRALGKLGIHPLTSRNQALLTRNERVNDVDRFPSKSAARP